MKKIKTKNIVVSGKRKTAIAKATIKPGTGKVTINKKSLSCFNQFQQLALKEPFILARKTLKDQLKTVDILVNVRGSGAESQVEASRLAIARAIIAYFKKAELRKTFLAYDRGLLVADTRRKEACKPNDSKARAKRQKSYR
ncbi:MAG: 30S ribosomal protein S9 [archaeon]|nr:MAG: 30S ribosomal protein S9 [archaeon]